MYYIVIVNSLQCHDSVNCVNRDPTLKAYHDRDVETVSFHLKLGPFSFQPFSLGSPLFFLLEIGNRRLSK